MSSTGKIFIDSSTPQCAAADLNGFKNENNNLIEGSGQTLSTSDNEQTHKAVSHYSVAGDFYACGGAANAITLAAPGSRINNPTVTDRVKYRFTATNTNTAATTVSVGGEAVKNLYLNGSALAGGEIVSGKEYEIIWNSSSSRYDIYRGGDNIIMSSGTWTPELWDSTLATDPTPPTYAYQNGEYTRFGDIVTVTCGISVTTLGGLTTTEQAFIGGLPFASRPASNAVHTFVVGRATSLNITAGTCVTGRVVPTSAYAELNLWDATTGTSNLLVSEFSAGGTIDFSVTYLI